MSDATQIKRAIIYFRVSHQDQDDKSQQRELGGYAKRNGSQIVREARQVDRATTAADRSG
jgi:DNA invertase Pin-like site-specific DNA recombinase